MTARFQGVARGGRVSVRTPAVVPSRSTSAPRRAKRPLVTTPTMLLSSVSSATGSGMASPATSRIRLPLSVVKPARSRGSPPSLDDLARDVGARHRDHLHRQREAPERGDELRLVGDADEGARDRGDDLLARERAAAALDHREALGDLVGAVDVDRQLVHVVEVEDRMPCERSRCSGPLGARDRAAEAPLHARELVDEAVGGRPGPDADDRVLDEVGDRRAPRCRLQFVLGHGLSRLRNDPILRAAPGPNCLCRQARAGVK